MPRKIDCWLAQTILQILIPGLTSKVVSWFGCMNVLLLFSAGQVSVTAVLVLGIQRSLWALPGLRCL